MIKSGKDSQTPTFRWGHVLLHIALELHILRDRIHCFVLGGVILYDCPFDAFAFFL